LLCSKWCPTFHVFLPSLLSQAIFISSPAHSILLTCLACCMHLSPSLASCSHNLPIFSLYDPLSPSLTGHICLSFTDIFKIVALTYLTDTFPMTR
jgi:hypothetical protein